MKVARGFRKFQLVSACIAVLTSHLCQASTCSTQLNQQSCLENQFQCASGSCVDRSFLCNGDRNCDDGSDETEEVCGNSRCLGNAFQCDSGACIPKDGKCNGRWECADGSDENPEFCGNAQDTPITNAVRRKRLSTQSPEIECGEIVVSEIGDRISFGESAVLSEHPWNVGLYKYNKSGMLELHCGGTLVSLRVVVTAAHCFSEGSAKINQNTIIQYKAVAGKYFSDWNETSETIQDLEIERVVLHRDYAGTRRNFENDIAVIILKRKIQITDEVRPVCVDYDESFYRYFSPGIVGNVVGWGWTEHQKKSTELLTASLPHVSHLECERKTPSEFHPFLTNDKFCAGKDKTAVCKGDSGGGYTVKFRHSSKWHLVGVVSIGPTVLCSQYSFAAFTNVYEHLEFIRPFVKNYV